VPSVNQNMSDVTQTKGVSHNTQTVKTKKMVQYLTHFKFSQHSGNHDNFIELTHKRGELNT
jgi:nitrate reductase alpha subunit